MFIWQQLNNDHHCIHIHVLSRSVFHIPEDVKHHFQLCAKVLRVSAVHQEQLWEEVCTPFTG